MIKLFINKKPISFEITKFPDGTSQVWHVDKIFEYADNVEIQFLWENNEAEVIHFLMLLDLVSYDENNYNSILLTIPYMPYARQDKEINNYTTFALNTFYKMLNSIVSDRKKIKIETFDLHGYNNLPVAMNIRPFFYHVVETFKPDVIFYPDKGAYTRYNKHVNEIVLFGEKIRDQSNGKIIDYQIRNSEYFNIQDKKILIRDDLCDGGATFVQAAKALKKLGAGEIALCVSHGVFSKGFDEMKEAGISQFFYTNSLIKNKDGFKIV